MTNEDNNKNRIFLTAVKLFAEKGYGNISMREIAGDVGIKAASIYNHYNSKEALLEAIFYYFKEQLAKEVFPVMELSAAVGVDPLQFLKSSLRTTNNFMERPVLRDIARIVMQEQFANKNIRSLLLSEMIRKPRMAFTRYFEQLIEKGIIRRINPELAAIEYHAYFIYRFYEKSLAPDEDAEKIAEEEKEMEAHLMHFWNSIRKEG